MTDQQIPPALTAEEWKDIKRPRMLAIAISNAADGCTPTQYSPDREEPESWHACAALCLHGQPSGFRSIHVDALQSLIDDRAANGLDISSKGTLRMAQEAVNRITALLPPREDT